MATHAAAATGTAVHFLVDNGVLVRGTLDPHTALALAVTEGEPWQIGYACEMACRPEPGDDDASPAEVADLAELACRLLASARPGLYRIVPAPVGDDEYGWYVRPARERGRGVFEGVILGESGW